MKKRIIQSFCIIALTLPTSLYPQKKLEWWTGPSIGYNNGIGGEGEFSLMNISPAFPLSVHLTVGYYHQVDPGQAVEARVYFINDNTGGNDHISEYGNNLFFQLDLSYPVYRKADLSILPYVGAVHGRYLAHFEYLGGNEIFDIMSNPWGISAGIRAYLKLSPVVMLGLSAGAGFFFPARIEGHDTFYNPDGLDDHPRDPYTYYEADYVVNQPVISPRIILSLLFRL